jgi:tripartite-type tricarboxylate transporter receptor subunit TctC
VRNIVALSASLTAAMVRAHVSSGGPMTLRRSYAALAALALFSFAAIAAEQWPTRPILAISPFAAGAANDLIARIVLDQAGHDLGRPFVIENRPGAGGVTGAASVARAEPDGYTLLLAASAMSAAVILHKSLPYDTLHDFAGVAMLGVQPSVLVSAPSKGFKTVADLVNAAKANPGALNFASAGVGSASHIAGEKFILSAKLDVQHVPYRGPVEAFADLMTGRIDFYLVPISPAVPMIEQGKITALAVSTPERSPLLPDVPTIAEAGYPDAAYLFWGAIIAPKNTSREIVGKIHDVVQKSLDLPEVQEKLTRLGVSPDPMTPDQFDKFFAEDVANTVAIGKAAHIEPTD